MICNFCSSPQNFLIASEANSVFSRNLIKDPLDCAGETSVELSLFEMSGEMSLFLTFAMFIKLSFMIGCIHSIEVR